MCYMVIFLFTKTRLIPFRIYWSYVKIIGESIKLFSIKTELLLTLSNHFMRQNVQQE